MKLVVCPHCGNRRIAGSRVPKDVVVVLPCPACHELVVLFRNKVVALNREVLEHGTFEERKAHIAEIVVEFLDPGMFSLPGLEMPKPEDASSEVEDTAEDIGGTPTDEDDPFRSQESPITQREMDRFVRIELQRIDDAHYFKKYFR